MVALLSLLLQSVISLIARNVFTKLYNDTYIFLRILKVRRKRIERWILHWLGPIISPVQVQKDLLQRRPIPHTFEDRSTSEQKYKEKRNSVAFFFCFSILHMFRPERGESADNRPRFLTPDSLRVLLK